MRAAAFSADGSVLAVAADTVITLWDPNNNVLIASIADTFRGDNELNQLENSSKLDLIINLLTLVHKPNSPDLS